MNQSIISGKRKTIQVSLSVVLISIYTIYIYHSVRPEINFSKLIQQIIRLSLSIGLLIMVYKGKNWARIVSIVLFTLAIIAAIVGMVFLNTSHINKIPLLVMIFIYSKGIYHFGFSKDVKDFFRFQNNATENF
ncbi:hypothetical protein [Tenacibaculum sp. M341]|uniref:hypothetical protein n=1 Tax=Tenacibaculum sp. M341 TaxID=2530339 RepID=UPI001047BABD|nr:hypothetical protein [Tenacibaculum sp. M341]TCI92699.1 hypothetical protein EYW44_07315 [Tenacibaculum sp. M341]